MTEVLVVYLHIAAMILIAVFLAIEYLVCVPELAREKVKLLARIDLLYLIAAVLALATGIVRIVWFGRAPVFTSTTRSSTSSWRCSSPLD